TRAHYVCYSDNLAMRTTAVECIAHGGSLAPRSGDFLVPRHYPAPPSHRCHHAFPGGPIPVSDQPWFCCSDEEWNTRGECLKQTPCPHCHTIGLLNRHGYLYGFDDSIPSRKILRARRVFCS